MDDLASINRGIVSKFIIELMKEKGTLNPAITNSLERSGLSGLNKFCLFSDWISKDGGLSLHACSKSGARNVKLTTISNKNKELLKWK